jgi:outer membrane protein insertion porin family
VIRFVTAIAGAFALLMVGLAGPALAQGQRPAGGLVTSGVIQRINVEGNNRVEPDTIRSYMTVAVGDPFDPGKLDASLKTLFATGLFADVTFSRQADDLVIKVVENPIINRIAFEGNRRLDDDALRQEVQLRPRVVFTRAKVQADVKRLLELYRRSGRFAVQVEPKIIQLEQNRVDLVFEVVEGELTGIQRISFIGNEKFSDGSLRDVVKTQESAWYRVLSQDDRYDPDRVNFDRELLRRFYLSEGYADFRVVSAVAELTPNRDAFFITYTLNEGDRYKFGKIDVTTRFDKLNVDALKPLVTIREGDWYNAEEVDNAIASLTEAVGSLGYAFVDIRPNVRRDKDKLVIDLTFEIQEGPRVYVERINISGNSRTLDKVIRREFTIVEGDAFNTAKIRRSQQRLRNLGFFEKVDIANQPGSAPDKTIVDVAVVEQSTGELSFGAGFSSASGLLGDVSIRERNLLGRGQDLRLGFSMGTESTQIDLSFTEPYFLDRDVAAGIDVFRIARTDSDDLSYDQTSIGFALRAGYSLTENTRHNLRYTLRQDDIRNVDNNASRYIKDQEGKSLTSEIGSVLTYDVRNNRQVPTSGYILRHAIDIAGLGGNERYIRNKVQGAYYYPIFEQVIASATGEAGVVLPISDELRISNRFFLGGDNLRGFAVGGAGPRDTQTDDALGGRYYYTGSLELSFPLGLPPEFGIFGKAFVDAGSSWHTEEKGGGIKDNHALRVAGGLGLQWFSPFGPIRIDYAIPVLKQSYDEVENFRFSFGTRF